MDVHIWLHWCADFIRYLMLTWYCILLWNSEVGLVRVQAKRKDCWHMWEGWQLHNKVMNPILSSTTSFLSFPCWLPDYSGFLCWGHANWECLQEREEKDYKGHCFPNMLIFEHSLPLLIWYNPARKWYGQYVLSCFNLFYHLRNFLFCNEPWGFCSHLKEIWAAILMVLLSWWLVHMLSKRGC